jgi:hypothetical protein
VLAHDEAEVLYETVGPLSDRIIGLLEEAEACIRLH